MSEDATGDSDRETAEGAQSKGAPSDALRAAPLSDGAIDPAEAADAGLQASPEAEETRQDEADEFEPTSVEDGREQDGPRDGSEEGAVLRDASQMSFVVDGPDVFHSENRDADAHEERDPTVERALEENAAPLEAAHADDVCEGEAADANARQDDQSDDAVADGEADRAPIEMSFEPVAIAASLPDEEDADALMAAEEARVAEEARLAEEARQAEQAEKDRLEQEARARAAAEEEERAAAEARALAEAEAQEKAERDAFIEENTLGSLLRGARATLGKHDMKIVEREIRIKARYLHAIEALDLDNLPSEAYLPGYVRTYAAHLRAALPLTPEQALAKFRVELAQKRGEPLDEAIPESDEDIARRAATRLTERVAPRISRTPIERAKIDKSKDEPSAGAAEAANARTTAQRAAAGRMSPAEALKARAEEARAAGAGAQRGRRIASLDPMAKIQRMGAEARAAAPKANAGKATAASAEVVARRRKAALEREEKRADEVARASRKARAAVLQGVREPRVDAVGPGVALLTAALVIGGLSYGVWSLLTNVQKVTLDENGERRLTVVETLDPTAAATGAARPSASAYERGGVLTEGGGGAGAAIDGPIGGLAGEAPRDAVEAALAQAARLGAGPDFALHALDVSWVRVSDARGAVVFAGRLDQGAVRALDLSKGPYRIRAGNAGGVALVVEGQVRGPLGQKGRVATITVRRKSDLQHLSAMPAATAALSERASIEDGPIGAPAPR